jgi:hypothetical protein
MATTPAPGSEPPKNPPRTDVRLLYLELAAEHIAPVKFIFEAYEEVAIVRTVDRRKAVIVLLIAPDFADDAESILVSLQDQFPCRAVEPPEPETDDWLMQRISAEAEE